MKFFYLFFLMLFTLSNYSYAEGKSEDFKTTGQKLREQGLSDNDICKMACESTFSQCYKNKEKNVVKCVAEILKCKTDCKKQEKK